MHIDSFISAIEDGFFAGVPDSLLSPLGDRLAQLYGTSGKTHIIAANEGNAVGLAVGYHLSTGRVPVVYLQNSGVGNIINPATSLLNQRVYGIPCLFIVGWRGKPGVHDEPQHVFMGEATLPLLQAAGICCQVLTAATAPEQLLQWMEEFGSLFSQGKSAALVVEKGALEAAQPGRYRNSFSLTREKAIALVAAQAAGCPVISTTGKASRELFELRERLCQGHDMDFLTVGGMGHCSSIALEIALQKPDSTVFCIDGDGAAIMHMGAMAVIGSIKPPNLIHVLINNCAHESVGGMPTAAGRISLCEIAKGCGYPMACRRADEAGLSKALEQAKTAKALCFIEACCSIGSRGDLGRPSTSAKENKEHFMKFLKDEQA